MGKQFRNIILDLGGVLFDVDYHRTLDDFRVLGVQNIDEKYSKLSQNHVFDDLETGKISQMQFRDQVRSWIPEPDLSDDMIDDAWNAMLIGLQEEAIRMVESLSKEYRLFLLSNTNAFHLPKLKEMEASFDRLEALFECCYYSHQIGRRKPHPSTFTYVLEENGLKAGESLFVDDSPQHIEGALKAGIPSFHHKDEGPLIAFDKALQEYRLPT